MATTKSNTSIWNAQSLTAGAGNTTSGTQTINTGYGGELMVKLTNGATGPTVAAQVQIQISGDNSKFYDFGGPMVGSVANSAVVQWSIDIPIGVMYFKLVAGSNTGQAVTVDADFSNVTGI